jgi:UDP-GlcNAc:undecaprenyl-phosphate GlcNAc-1-phosphate transferase
MIYLSSLLISMVITILLIPVLRGIALRCHAGLDQPGERKVHTSAVPRTGGVGMSIGATIPVFLWAPFDPFTLSLMMGSAVIVIFGVLDDFRNLGPRVKLAAQLVAALVIWWVGGVQIRFWDGLLPAGFPVPEWMGAGLTILLIVGVTDAINLSDGLDGLAGGISILSFLCIGFLALVSGHSIIALFSAAVVGSVLGFLRFNTHPATVFMGDCGSQMLGFFAISLSLGLTQGHAGAEPFVHSPILPLLLVGVPVLDTLTVMTQRILEGKSPFVGDKKHFHHKLLRLNLSHREAVFVLYALQTLLVTFAFILRFRPAWILLALYLFFCFSLLGFFGAAEAKGWRWNRGQGWFDRELKGRIRRVRKRRIPLRIVFGVVRLGLPALLLISCFLPDGTPRMFFFPGLLFLVVAFFLWNFRAEWLGGWLSAAFYMISPVIIYLSEKYRAQWMSEGLMDLYNYSFFILFFCVVLTLRFTRRQEGFKSNPLDFLILFFALVVPNLPDPEIQNWRMGLVAAKVIVMYFSFEVLVGELRGETQMLRWSIVTTLIILTVRMAVSI